MNPRKPLCCWQFFAQALACAKSAFAPTRAGLQDKVLVDPVALAFGPRHMTHCDPFPMNWPSPVGVGPLFVRGPVGLRFGRNSAHRAGASARGHGILPFVSMACALESGDITTPFRGRPSCRNSSFFFSSQRRLRAVCKTQVHAGLQGLSLARPLPMRRMRTLSQARPLAGLQALRPAPFRARLVADQIDLTAQKAVITITPATHGDIPRGWPFHFRPARAALT
ncbi:MAG: hypothetical protein RL128_1777 [Pseudomonadota bacterium]